MNAMTHGNVQTAFVDQFGRSKRKLRISVTDRCNFKCVYCMPEHPEWMKKNELLSFEELYQFCDFMVRHGIEHIRITGGEPLMRKGVVHFIQELQRLKKIGLKKVSMTTNAHYLDKYVYDLKIAGLDDINVSLDSLDEEQFQQLTQKQLQPVLAGIQAAVSVGIPIKINTVLIKGINENQITRLAEWAILNKFELRFIEFMPLDGDANWSQKDVVTEAEILNQLKQKFDVVVKQKSDSHPARRYLIKGHCIGIISTISNSFCGTCDRLRLTAKGDFFNCLFAKEGRNLKDKIEALNNMKAQQESDLTTHSVDDLEQDLSSYIWSKKSGFHAIQHELNPIMDTTENSIKSNLPSRKISMYMIGG